MNTGKVLMFVLLVVLLSMLMAACTSALMIDATPVVQAESSVANTPTIAAADTPGDPEPAAATREPDAVVATPEAAVEDDPVSRAASAYSAPSEASGQVLVLTGQVLDTSSAPIPGARVEIWQTDASGVYDHPGDPGTSGRDLAFQFFGSSSVDEQGYYLFRTIRPGAYGGRPPHIHVKVFQGENELLTTQFYFAEDFQQVQGEAIFSQAGDQGGMLLLELEERLNPEGNSVLVAYKNLVIDQGSGGDLVATPRQVEGPYYPVVDVADFDTDLTVVE